MRTSCTYRTYFTYCTYRTYFTYCTSSYGWKLRTLLRTRRFYIDADMIAFYKAHLLSYLEYRTPAIYHAIRAVLSCLDAVQTLTLMAIRVNELTSLVSFRLAPLSTRRDIDMLGILHRTMLGKGPNHFSGFFPRETHSIHITS